MILSIEERNFIENTYEIVVGVELSLSYQIKKILDLCLKIDYELYNYLKKYLQKILK